MTAPITRYAIEHDPRDYTLTSFKLTNGFEYQGICLFTTPEEAQRSIDDDIANAKVNRDEAGLDEDGDDYVSDDELEDDRGSVAEIRLHADGQIFNGFGHNIAVYVGAPNGQSVEDVAVHVAEYFKHVTKGVKKERRYESDGPQP